MSSRPGTRRAVDAPGGHVYQSMAWATHRETSGWQPKFLLAQDGGAVLGLMRPWSGIRGASAYIPRGPSGAGFVDGARLAARQVAAAQLLAAAGSDVVAADPEVPADVTAYRDVITAAGFRPIEEIQPSRHRVSLPLGRGADEAAVLADVAKSTRQRIRAAERDGVEVVRHDSRVGPDGEGEGFVPPATPTPTCSRPLLRPAARDRRAADSRSVRGSRSSPGGRRRMRPAISSTSRQCRPTAASRSPA